MKIEFHPYKLISKYKGFNDREGALIRIIFSDDLIGYADCHPWPELGDANLSNQLNLLQKGQPTVLMKQSLAFAEIDALARKQNRSLFENQTVPDSHYLVVNLNQFSSDDLSEIIDQKFSHVKIKLGRNFENEIDQLIKLFSTSSIKLRLDFNEKLSREEFHFFLKKTEKLHPYFDYIEDPVPFDKKSWSEINISLAADRHASEAIEFPKTASKVIVKPAIQPIDPFRSISKRVIITSYLDHPIGQLAAAYTASWIDPKGHNIHGLLSHHAYRENAFSSHLTKKGSKFLVPYGTGFGFDHELATLDWRKLG